MCFATFPYLANIYAMMDFRSVQKRLFECTRLTREAKRDILDKVDTASHALFKPSIKSWRLKYLKLKCITFGQTIVIHFLSYKNKHR